MADHTIRRQDDGDAAAPRGLSPVILVWLIRRIRVGRTRIASDVSAKMLAIAKRRFASHAGRVQLQQLDAEAMPSVPDGSVDAYSLSLGLKICHRGRVLNVAFPRPSTRWATHRPGSLDYGSEAVTFERLSLGIVAIHAAYKPRADQ